jgi:hypothetical protein
MAEDMKLIITIDTEEDKWDDYGLKDYTVNNIDRIDVLQQLFDNFNIKPTYLVTYPVATNDRAVSLLSSILKAGKCEIGTHCHPWSTPPFEEEKNLRNSMLCNLPSDLQYKKISLLRDTIQKKFSIRPISFRCGRWGYNQDVAVNLVKLGYKVDTSIITYTDWSIYEGPDFANISPKPFRFATDDIFREVSDGHLLEIPATVGFLQQNFKRYDSVLNIIKKRSPKFLKLEGILYRAGMLNKIWLSPEVSDAKNMIDLTISMRKNNYKIINMVFHSSSLQHGLTPFVKTRDDEKRFLERIKEFLIYTSNEGIESITLSDSLRLV